MKKLIIIILTLCIIFSNVVCVYADDEVPTTDTQPVENVTEDPKEQDTTKPTETKKNDDSSEEDKSSKNDSSDNDSKEPATEEPKVEEPVSDKPDVSSDKPEEKDSDDTNNNTNDDENNSHDNSEDNSEDNSGNIDNYDKSNDDKSTNDNSTDDNSNNTKKPVNDEPKAKEPDNMAKGSTRAANILTYDPDTEKYFYDGEEHTSFPVTGEYVLGSNIVLKSQVAPIGNLIIDFDGYNIIDNYSGTNWLFTIQQNDDVTFKGTGELIYQSDKRHTAIYINNGGHFEMTDNVTIRDFATSSNGAAISINHANDIAIMSGNSKIINCSTNASTGGGGVNVYRGKFYMKDNASITECQNTYSPGAEKKGNGAGVQVGNNGTLYMLDNSSITNCHGTGYHGAGVDLWSSGIMYLSGSPTILNNTNGKDFPCNLYAGCPVHINGLMTGSEHSIGISIQTDPVFTRGLKENNPDADINNLIHIFVSDRHYWTDIPRHEEYSIINHDDIEAEQAPVVVVHFMYNYGEAGEYLAKEVVPGGTTTKPADPSRTGYNFNGWYKNPECTGSAWSASNTVPVYDDLYLYAKWIPKQYTITTQLAEGSEEFATVSDSSTQDYDSVYEFSTQVTNELYSITSIKIDNTELLTEPVSQYQESMIVDGNHTITVTTEKTKALVTLIVTENDYADKFTLTSDNPMIVDLNTIAVFEYIVEDGYYIDKIIVNDEEVENLDNITIAADTNIEVTISKMLAFNVNYVGETDHITSPIEPSSVILPGSNKQFDVTVQEGYYIEQITINGVNQTLTNEQTTFSFDLQNIIEDQNITIKIAEVEFIPEPTGTNSNSFSIIFIFIITAITLFISKLKKKFN